MKKLYTCIIFAVLAQLSAYSAKVLDVNFNVGGNHVTMDSFTSLVSVPWGYARIYDMDIMRPRYPDIRPAMMGRALHFDGYTHIEVPDNNAIDFSSTSPFSISFWMKTSSTQSNNTIIDKRPDGGAGYHVTLYNGYLLFQLNNGSSHYNFWSSSSPKLNDNKWHHVAITVQRNSTTGIRFYVDGTLVGTHNSQRVSGSISNSARLLIGGHSTSGSYRFKGEIDEVAIYNTALSSTQVGLTHWIGSFPKQAEAT